MEIMSELILKVVSGVSGKSWTTHKYIQKRLKKMRKIANSLHEVCTGVGSLTPLKDAIEEIQKILNEKC